MSAGFAWGAAAPPPTKLPCTTDCGPSSHPSNECASDWDCPHSDPCLVGDCHSGHCHHVPLCYDYNDCTVDTCDANGVCTFTPDDTLSCDDGVACTADVCSGGVCISTADDTLPCGDAVACTIDACVGGVCISTPDDSLCDDFLRCTHNHCGSGGCTFPPFVCDDANFCTLGDYCDPIAFCQSGLDSPCSGSTPVCDGAPNNRCVECLGDNECSGNPVRRSCNDVTGVCVQCIDGTQCQDPLPPVCNLDTGTCVECVLPSDCVDDGNPCTDLECWSDNTCYTGQPRLGCCQTDADCSACGNICDLTDNTCVFVPADDDGDTVDNCSDPCAYAGCPANDGCACVEGANSTCCDPTDPNKLCCDPIDPNSWCPCNP